MEYSYLNNLDRTQTETDMLNKQFIDNNSLYSKIFWKIEIIRNNILFKKLILLLFVFVFNFFTFEVNLDLDLFDFQQINNVIPNTFLLSKYFKNLYKEDKEEEVYFNITSINFSIESKSNIILSLKQNDN